MTSNGSPVLPPRATAWLVELFASAQEAEGILGDLAEEFHANIVRLGDKEARRHYRLQAWRTIRDLAVSPLCARPSSNAGVTASGLMLTAGIGLAGVITIWPVGGAIDKVARAVVTRYPVYYYIPASVFWGGLNLLGPLMAGVLVAFAARRFRFRPMSAALAMVAVIAVWLAVDVPIMMWLYGPPLVVRTSYIARWATGVLMFGGATVVGAAIGRMVAAGDNSVQLRPSAE